MTSGLITPEQCDAAKSHAMSTSSTTAHVETTEAGRFFVRTIHRRCRRCGAEAEVIVRQPDELRSMISLNDLMTFLDGDR